MLQPVIYGLALEALCPTRPCFPAACSSARRPAASAYEIPLLGDAPGTGSRCSRSSIARSSTALLAAQAGAEGLRYCDFEAVCGRQEERRTRRKARELFADLDALRGMP